MSLGVNRVILVGRLGQDPEIKHTAGGKSVANLKLATARSWTNKQTGERTEETEWHKIVFFGALAGIAEQYLRKGDAAYIEGRLQTRKWTDRDGADRYTTEIVGETMNMLGSKEGKDASRPSGGAQDYAKASGRSGRAPAQRQLPQEEFDDDIPF